MHSCEYEQSFQYHSYNDGVKRCNQPNRMAATCPELNKTYGVRVDTYQSQPGIWSTLRLLAVCSSFVLLLMEVMYTFRAPLPAVNAGIEDSRLL